MKLTTYQHIVPKLKMIGAIPLFHGTQGQLYFQIIFTLTLTLTSKHHSYMGTVKLPCNLQ